MRRCSSSRRRRAARGARGRPARARAEKAFSVALMAQKCWSTNGAPATRPRSDAWPDTVDHRPCVGRSRSVVKNTMNACSVSAVNGREGGSPRSKPSTSCAAAHAAQQSATFCTRQRPRKSSCAARRRAWTSGCDSGSTASTKFSKFANAAVCCLKERARPSPAATPAAWILRGEAEGGNVSALEKLAGEAARTGASRQRWPAW